MTVDIGSRIDHFVPRAWMVALLFPVLLFWWVGESWRYNRQIEQLDWRSDLRADAAGYYIYLPALFQYSFRASGVDENARVGSAAGFHLDRQKDRIVTKYTYGVALLELPFFLMAEVYVGAGATDGFSEAHRRAIEVAGITYWLAGLALLAFGLWRWKPMGIVAVLCVLGLVSFGSNVFYYAFRMPGYSHIHSFFLVCLSIGTMPVKGMSTKGRDTWLFQLACALIVLVRPTDLLLVFFLYAWFWQRTSGLRWSTLTSQLLIGAMVSFPQLLYWRFVHGTWLYYSYGSENFSEWATPHVKEFLFAAQNGWLPYAPALLLVPFGIFSLYRKEPGLLWLCLGVTAMAVYLNASWFTWRYGCSFGARPMVQYMPVIAVLLWDIMRATEPVLKQIRIAFLPLLTLLCFINYRASLQYSGCINGDEVWNWKVYLDNLVQAFL
ncbi:MAG: hypothetical protein IT229_00715 [Flavobacteriales bacterium]|nr:hypothetical protein [Flavobacteriales bacterium]